MNRHERRRAASRTRQIIAPAAALPRVMKFLEAFQAAPNDAEIEIRGGVCEAGEASILISISGGGDHVLMVAEARKVADIMEDVMREHPNEPEAATPPNIIMCIRAGCDKTETTKATT